MSGESHMRRVTAINNGTVIDHIPAGHAITVLKMLGVDGRRSTPITLAMNVPSKKMGAKDVVKIEDREITQAELDRLALIAPEASVSIIRAYSVAEKLVVNLGGEIIGVARCCFSNCVSWGEREPLPHRLKVHSTDPLELRCHYCGRSQDLDGVIDNLL